MRCNYLGERFMPLSHICLLLFSIFGFQILCGVVSGYVGCADGSDERNCTDDPSDARNGNPRLLLSNRKSIRQFDLLTNRSSTLLSGLSSAVAMDVIVENMTVVWSDVVMEKIFSCHLGRDFVYSVADSNSMAQNCTKQPLVSKDISTPDGLTIDWIHNLLFWTDTGKKTISVTTLDGSRRRKTLFSSGLDEPRAIVVDPKRGLIFWTDWGETPKIEVAGADGSNRKVIVSDEKLVKWPNGLAIDRENERIYWADAKLKHIVSAFYNGSAPKILVNSSRHVRHPFSIDVFEEKMYWTDWVFARKRHDTEAVCRANRFTGEEIEVFVTGASPAMALRVAHQESQQQYPNKCALRDCSYLCLPTPHFPNELAPSRSFQCACPDGHQLQNDERSCANATLF